LKEGWEVDVLDTLLFGASGILDNPHYRLQRTDVRSTLVLESDVVVHLAALVGEPLCSKFPDAARDINIEGTKAVIEAAERGGVSLFVFPSTCSLYGWRAEEVDETTDLEPTNLYAETKMLGEDWVQRSSIESKVILRLATLFGASPRMRLDLILNQFVASKVKGETVKLFEPKAWRPILHVRDAAKAIIQASALSGQNYIVNVGYGNYRKETVAQMVPDLKIQIEESIKDRRSYRVSFRKMLYLLGPRTTAPESSIGEIEGAIRTEPMWTDNSQPKVKPT